MSVILDFTFPCSLLDTDDVILTDVKVRNAQTKRIKGLLIDSIDMIIYYSCIFVEVMC